MSNWKPEDSEWEGTAKCWFCGEIFKRSELNIGLCKGCEKTMNKVKKDETKL